MFNIPKFVRLGAPQPRYDRLSQVSLKTEKMLQNVLLVKRTTDLRFRVQIPDC